MDKQSKDYKEMSTNLCIWILRNCCVFPVGFKCVSSGPFRKVIFLFGFFFKLIIRNFLDWADLIQKCIKRLPL